MEPIVGVGPGPTSGVLVNVANVGGDRLFGLGNFSRSGQKCGVTHGGGA